jgi:hypothetical protein
MLAVETIERIRREHFVKGEAYWHRRFADRRAASGSLAAKAGKRQGKGREKAGKLPVCVRRQAAEDSRCAREID